MTTSLPLIVAIVALLHSRNVSAFTGLVRCGTTRNTVFNTVFAPRHPGSIALRSASAPDTNVADGSYIAFPP